MLYLVYCQNTGASGYKTERRALRLSQAKIIKIADLTHRHADNVTQAPAPSNGISSLRK